MSPNQIPALTVLILRTGKSSRNLLAEKMMCFPVRELLDGRSAGSKAAGYVHPLTVRAMAETGNDGSSDRSQPMSEYIARPVETVITVFRNAEQACSIFVVLLNRHYRPFDDPPNATGTEAGQIERFRRVRNGIRRSFTADAEVRCDMLKRRRGWE
jgi:arsenate reductase